MANKWENNGNSDRLYLLEFPKSLQMVTAGHEIKRLLLLGRITMTNLDSIFKIRDITFADKGIVSPVVMSRCENCTKKKVEHWRIDAFELLKKTLESPLDCKEVKSVKPKGNQPRISTGRTDAVVEAPILWPLDMKS